MKNSKLTPDKMQELFTFCYKRGVKEYEIQEELVDHLATAIETLQEQQSTIGFQEALNHAYAEFGNMGFEQLVKSKKRAFRNQYNRLFLKFMGTFFRLPRIILTLALILILFTIIRFIEPTKIVTTYTLGILFAFHFWNSNSYHSARYGISKLGIKSFLLENYFNRLKSRANDIIFGFNVSFLLFTIYFSVPENAWFDLLISFLLVLIIIYYYATMFYMPKLVKRHFEERFPQFVKS